MRLSDFLPVAQEHLWRGKDAHRSLARAFLLVSHWDPSLPEITDPYGTTRDMGDDYSALKAHAWITQLGAERGWSGATKNRYRAALSSLLRAAHLSGHPKLPLPPSWPEGNPRDRVITLPEEEALLGVLSGTIRTLLILLLDTGLRLSEVYKAVPHEGGLQVDDTKNGRSRWVPLSKRLSPLSLRLPHERTLRRRWTAEVGVACRALDIEPFTPHTCRHTAITRWVQRGIEMPTVRALAGHQSPATTWRYFHPTNDFLAEALDRAPPGGLGWTP